MITFTSEALANKRLVGKGFHDPYFDIDSTGTRATYYNGGRLVGRVDGIEAQSAVTSWTCWEQQGYKLSVEDRLNVNLEAAKKEFIMRLRRVIANQNRALFELEIDEVGVALVTLNESEADYLRLAELVGILGRESK